MQDRSYQVEAVNAVWNYFYAGNTGNPLIAMPTGTGKSIVIARLLWTILNQYPNQKILVLTHVKELIEQNYSKLIGLWPNAPAGIYSAGLNRRDVLQRIIFAGIASIAKKWAEFGRVDLIIIDECHLVSPKDDTMYRSLIRSLQTVNPQLKVIGLTATPYRLGHGLITDGEDPLFTDICFDITDMASFNRLIAEGFLAPLIPKNTKLMLDVDNVHMRGGDFIAGELQTAVNKEDITAAALREAMELGYNRKKWLVFCSGVEHSIAVSEMLNSFGISCAAIHSKLTDAERDQWLIDYKEGRLQALTNNNVLTTGFDAPEIDLILMLRPTASTVLWVQMLGRGTRPFPTKENCMVLDYAGNTGRLGPINDPLVPRMKGKKPGKAPVKICGHCNTWNHTLAKFCINPECGKEFVFQSKLHFEASEKNLIKGDLPQVEIFKVDHITYSEYNKMDKPPMMKVTYYCGLRKFDEYICFQHEGFPQRKARQWWAERTQMQFPTSTKDAIDKAELINAATHLRIWVNKKYPEIMKVCYDGTAFNTQEAVDEKPTVQSANIPQRSPGYGNVKQVKQDNNPTTNAAQIFEQLSCELNEPVEVFADGEDDLPF